MISLSFLGAAREVGRSAILLETDSKFLFDYGIKINRKGQPPSFPLEPVGYVDKVIISHAHLDHIGYLPRIFDHYNVQVLATAPTHDLAGLLFRDAEKLERTPPYKKTSSAKALGFIKRLEYEKPLNFKRNKITAYDAGHIIGAMVTLIEYAHHRIVYTGDMKYEDTLMHRKAVPVRCDTLITESTYSNRPHPPRHELEKKLIAIAEQTISKGGVLLLPAFAVGRAQELVRALHMFDNVYLDGMAIQACEIALSHPDFMREPGKYESALGNVTYIKKPNDRAKILARGGIVITTAGMLEGGPALSYIPRLNKNSRIVMTGHCVDGTNGRKLLETKTITLDKTEFRVKTPVDYLDLSAHAGRDDLLRYINKCAPERIFVVHGDDCVNFASELSGMGYDACAPSVGERFEVK